MDKIALLNVSEDKILYFLECENREKVSAGQVIFFAVWNIVNFCIALCFVEHKILWSIIFSLFNLVIIISLYYFVKKIEHNQKNNNLFQGIYCVFMMISACSLSDVLLKQYFMDNIFWFWCIPISLSICVGIITSYIYIRRIHSGEDADLKKLMSSLGVGIVVLLTPFSSKINACLFFGILFGFVSITSLTGIYYFIKAYCYHVIEQETKKREIPQDRIVLIENSTGKLCKKAKEWLEEKQIKFDSRDISKKNIWISELRYWKEKSGIHISDFFDMNSSVYKRMRLKERLLNMSEEEQYELLISNQSLMKLPIVVSDNFIIIGFKEYEWEEKLLCEKRFQESPGKCF